MIARSRRSFLTFCGIAAAATVATTSVDAKPPSLLRMFGKATPIPQADSMILTEEDGPWLILATTFVGENSQARAERTAREIREKLRLPAFIYKEDFSFTGDASSPNQTGYRARYANPHSYQAHAVLVGEYDSVQNDNVDRDLTALKKADLDVFRDAKEVAAEYNVNTPINTVKTWGQQIFKSRKGHTKSPLANAFVTRNPLLPEAFFSQPAVDSFVQELNDGVPHSLLDCDGKFTVIVRTFEGFGTIVDGKQEKNFNPSEARMAKLARDANRMVTKLRADGEDAYQFHDRHRSIVTVGSFETLGRELPDGGFLYDPEIRQVMERFSAFNASVARQVPGRTGIAANHAAMIPFDVQPTPISVPKISKRSLYSALGRR
ncbi:twin-arginine translocation signal domain-containing protein [Stieleria varia]|uniref:Uncharacterized protein n=1 Tax=Stieleria varia TaxID=2528005 RepID=A0A5C6B2Z8_9BACT|nr:twin-arginine translocation signal domain-containing protein [Stieleria varia]TWU05872.1 hypothetical protein Pla52n_15870 [Stieleria varia]